VQARLETRGWLGVGIMLGLLGLVIVLSAIGVITLNPQAIGQSMTYILVGTAVAYFAYLFIAGGLVGDEKKRVAVIFVLFVFAAIFWSAFEQAPTSLNLFARDFTDRVIDFSWIPTAIHVPFLALGGAAIAAFIFFVAKMLGGKDDPPSARLIVGLLVAGTLLLTIGWFAGSAEFEIPATWFQSVNALFVIILAPVFAWLWVAMSRRGGDLSSPAKFSLGLLCAGVGFMLMIWAANQVVASDGNLLVSPWWLVGSYFFQTVGELALSPVGLSSMTKLSPQRYVGQMMGIWFLASAVGNLIGGLVGGHVDPENLEQMPTLFTATTVSLLVAAVVLALLIVPIRRMMATTGKTDL
jgi:dipeptide/tripeptide permease